MAKALAILLLALLAFSGGADAKRLKKVKVKRIESLAQTNASFPSISFVGGLELSDGNEHFGGWSGLATRDQGRSAVAVSDKGWWLTLDVEYANDSTPVGVDDVRIHPLLDEVGKALDERKKAWSDAESVVFADKEDPTSGMLVSFERHHRIWSYESVEANATTNSALIVASVALGAHCAYNGGAEGIEVLTPGVGSPRLASMVFFCEDAMADHPNIFQGWVVPVASDGETAQAKPIFMELGEGYRPTDLAVLEGGDLLVLQRMHKGHDATGMRIGLVPSDLIRWALRTSSPAYSASHEGESVLVPAQVLEVIKSPTTLIDNMEGLSLDYLGTNKEDPNRAVRLSLISDDNFSDEQKTVFLVFEAPRAQDLVDFGKSRAKIVPFPAKSEDSGKPTTIMIIFGAVFGGLAFLVAVGAAICITRSRRARGARYQNFVELTKDDFGAEDEFNAL